MKVTTVEQATHWLLNQINPIPREDMDKMYLAMEYVGNPHKDLPVIHVTGTNGKGSTVAFLRELLMSQGLSVGSFTSPHIEKFNERIVFNHDMISDEDLIRLTNVLIDLNDYMATTEYGILIYFELFTVMMALYFKEKQPDICIIEAGIGGMHDCTNILEGQVAVITSIGLDHADLLGDTYEEVALEKAGIIKSQRPAVTGWIQPSPLEVISKWAKARRSDHSVYDEAYGVRDQVDLKNLGSRFTFWSNKLAFPIENLTIQMVGDHQVRNAATSLQTFIVWMQAQNRSIDWDQARKALEDTHWIGRLERLSSNPLVYLDGAHNMEGITALKGVVEHQFADFDVSVLYGGLRKKNQTEQVPFLLTYPADKVVFSTFKHFEAMSVAEFQAILDKAPDHAGVETEITEDWQAWIQAYLKDHQDNDRALLLITGSLYFVSEVRQFMVELKKVSKNQK